MPRAPCLRPAIAADAPRIAALDARTAASPRPPDFFARYCPPAQTGDAGAARLALVIEGEEGLLGYLVYSRVAEQAEVVDLLVEPARRGQGTGGRLLRRALADMRQAGMRRCLLEVRASNAAAIALYRGEGFQCDGRRTGYYPLPGGGREDALLMSKEL